jgi:hypothetical protein
MEPTGAPGHASWTRRSCASKIGWRSTPGAELMTSWKELTKEERTALRRLAKGEVREVPWRVIRRLREHGLADDYPEGRLTPTGVELWRARPMRTGRWK